MSEQTAPGPTIHDILFASPPGGAALGSWLRRSHALRRLAKAAAAVAGNVEGPICSQTSDAIADLMSLNIVDVILDAWAAEGALLAAARATASDPSRTEHVTLASQTVTWSSAPWVDIRVDEVPLGRVDITLEVTVEITALEADVHAGCLVAFTSGKCTATAALAVNGHKLEKHELVDLHAPLEWRMASGIRLVMAGPETLPPPPPPPPPDAGSEVDIRGQPSTSAYTS